LGAFGDTAAATAAAAAAAEAASLSLAPLTSNLCPIQLPTHHPPLQAAKTPAATRAAPTTAVEDATPLARLFDRFDALAIDRADAPAAATPLPPRAGGPARGATLAAAAAAAAAAMPPATPASAAPRAAPERVPALPGSVRTPLGPARRVQAAPPCAAAAAAAGPASRVPAGSAPRVSFTTPVVHRYSGAARRNERGEEGDPGVRAARSPASSTAGHTPYSLASSRGGGGAKGAAAARVAGVSPPGALDFGGADDHTLRLAEGEEREEDEFESSPAGRGGFAFLTRGAAAGRAEVGGEATTPASKAGRGAEAATPTLLFRAPASAAAASGRRGAEGDGGAAGFLPFASECLIGALQPSCLLASHC
jgi:hypothetical protein